jgi:tetratricopeptide (TPR) repeat protein
MVAFVDIYGRLELDRAFANHADLLRLAGDLDESLKWYAYSLCAGGGWVERNDGDSHISSSSSRIDRSEVGSVDDSLSDLATPKSSAKSSAKESLGDEGGDHVLPVLSSEATWVGIGQLRLEQKQWGDAAAAFEEALAICPRNVKAWTNLGLALSQQRKVEQQKLQQQQLQSSSEDLSKSVENLLEGALHAFRKAASLSDFDTEPLCNLALLLGEVGDHGAAVTALRDAATRAATDRDLGSGGCSQEVEADVQCRLGVALYDSGDVPGAIIAFEAALAIDPSNASARNNAAALRAASAAAQK